MNRGFKISNHRQSEGYGLDSRQRQFIISIAIIIIISYYFSFADFSYLCFRLIIIAFIYALSCKALLRRFSYKKRCYINNPSIIIFIMLILLQSKAKEIKKNFNFMQSPTEY